MLKVLTIKSRNPEAPHDLHHRAYRTHGDRRRAITQLRKHGWNYFVQYLEACPRAFETGQRLAIQYSVANWVQPGGVYIDR